MTVKTILVHVETVGSSLARLQLAAKLAERFNARLVGFAACGVRPMASSIESGVIDVELMQQFAEDNRKRLQELEKQFAACVGGTMESEWRTSDTAPTAVLAQNARAADLIVSGSPLGAERGDFYQQVDLSELLLSIGRPVLVAGEGMDEQQLDRVVIAWKDSKEARRAVIDALPLLKAARDVLVVTVGDGDKSATEQGLADVARYLQRHGVKTRTQRVDLIGKAGGQILEIAAGMNADLIVAGAYGHSRLREWVFGGVTRELLDAKAVSRFMSS